MKDVKPNWEFLLIALVLGVVLAFVALILVLP